ncbi:hypothetical protein ACD961_17395, partial [Escherichia coli]
RTSGEKRVFLVILFTSFSGSLVSRISGAVHCVIWYRAPSVVSAGAAGASCSGWRANCKPECQEKTKPAEAGMLKQTESNIPDL